MNSIQHYKGKIDIAEDYLLDKYPDVLEILLKDRTTNRNIFWATENYIGLGKKYDYFSEITVDLITGKNNKVITPRISKDKLVQDFRIKVMAEVFTPAWVCNAQINQIDESWFGKKNIFNKETRKNRNIGWQTNDKKIMFPKNKIWLDYIKDKRLEITCGEAPYITSRYDTTTGLFIDVSNRIGILDRKLRVVNENTTESKEWLDASKIAYKSTYAYEWQGDSLLLAREAMLYTFIENYLFKFKKKPPISAIRGIARIISWNVWQMDGLTGTIPLSCLQKKEIKNLFNEKEFRENLCAGCSDKKISKHNGIYCKVKNWEEGGKNGRVIQFIDILE